jgi:hypothetical protein
MAKKEKEEFPGYPQYPESEDIYRKAKETEFDPEDTKHLKQTEEVKGKLNEKNFKDDVTGGDLDIPGAELDDAQEEIGSEDEENNLYSGSDDRED